MTKSILFIILFFSLTNLIAEEKTANGVDGVEFVPAPLNIDNNCRMNVFMGTTRFQGIAYVMPFPQFATDSLAALKAEAWQVNQTKYRFRFGIHLNYDQSSEQSCSLLSIKRQLNQILDKDQQINSLSKLNMQRVSIRLDIVNPLTGAKISPTWVGENNTNILNVSGSDTFVSFDLDSEQYRVLTHDFLQMGIQVYIDYHFTAREPDGKINIKIDFKQLADHLESQFKGKIQVVDADLAVGIERALSQLSMEAKIESSSDQSFNDLAQKILENYIITQKESFQNPAIPDADCPKKEGDSLVPTYNLCLVLKSLRTEQTQNISVSKLGDKQTFTATVPILMSKDLGFIDDPSMKKLILQTNSPWEYVEFPKSPMPHMIRLVPFGKFEHQIKLAQTHYNYLSKDDILSGKYDSTFPLFQQPKLSLRLNEWTDSNQKQSAYLSTLKPFAYHLFQVVSQTYEYVESKITHFNGLVSNPNSSDGINLPAMNTILYDGMDENIINDLNVEFIFKLKGNRHYKLKDLYSNGCLEKEIPQYKLGNLCPDFVKMTLDPAGAIIISALEENFTGFHMTTFDEILSKKVNTKTFNEELWGGIFGWTPKSTPGLVIYRGSETKTLPTKKISYHFKIRYPTFKDYEDGFYRAESMDDSKGMHPNVMFEEPIEAGEAVPGFVKP